MAAPTREFLLDMLTDARIKGAPLDEKVDRATDPDYWRRLVPGFHVDSGHAALEFGTIAPAVVDDATRAQQQDGYFRLPGAIAPAGVRRLNDAIDTVVAAGWPAAFVFMYDEAWQAARSASAGKVLESVLGAGFLQIRHVWVHVVNPVEGATGWAPHVDGDPGLRMTVWVALTEATLDNGCMHVIPRSAIAQYPNLVPRFRADESQFSRNEIRSLLHATHALVASPGDALGWGFDVIHWGGYARRSGHERRGLSFEFIARDQESGGYDGPLVSMNTVPSFRDRLHSVATGVVAYRKFEPLVDRFVDVAEAIVARLV